MWGVESWHESFSAPLTNPQESTICHLRNKKITILRGSRPDSSQPFGKHKATSSTHALPRPKALRTLENPRGFHGTGRSGRVESGGFHISRVGSGRVGPVHPDPTQPTRRDPIREKPWKIRENLKRSTDTLSTWESPGSLILSDPREPTRPAKTPGKPVSTARVYRDAQQMVQSGLTARVHSSSGA